MNIVITANSPGEVASWLRPIVGAFQRHAPDARIHVCLAPCAYSTGAEEDVVRSIPGVSHVYPPRTTVAWALRGRRPAPLPEGEPGVVLYLGGDQMYGVLLGWRTGWPAAAYIEGRPRWVRRFQRFFVPHDGARRQALRSGAPAEAVVLTGDLMLDGLTLRWPQAEGRKRLDVPGEAPVVGLFPGSRRHELNRAFPLQMQAAAYLKAMRPHTRFLASISPFATRKVVTEALQREGLFSPTPEKLVATLFPEEDGRAAGFPWSNEARSVWVEWMPQEAGAAAQRRRGRPGAVQVQLVRGAPYDVAASSDAVVTIPGSNTAELGGLGVPMVVALPLQYIQEIPLDGLPGLIGGVPLLGPAIKRRAIERLSRRVTFLAWPNRRAGRMIVPELRKDQLSAQEIAEAAADLLDDAQARESMARQLRETMGAAGASDRIATACLQLASR